MCLQTNWEVMLDGDPQGLRSMAGYQTSNNYFRVWGGLDDWNDCLNDHFSFDSIYFENEQDHYAVWQLSYELLSLFNGASELFYLNSKKLSIIGINFDEISTTYIKITSPLGF